MHPIAKATLEENVDQIVILNLTPSSLMALISALINIKELFKEQFRDVPGVFGRDVDATVETVNELIAKLEALMAKELSPPYLPTELYCDENDSAAIEAAIPKIFKTITHVADMETANPGLELEIEITFLEFYMAFVFIKYGTISADTFNADARNLLRSILEGLAETMGQVAPKLTFLLSMIDLENYLL